MQTAHCSLLGTKHTPERGVSCRWKELQSIADGHKLCWQLCISAFEKLFESLRILRAQPDIQAASLITPLLFTSYIFAVYLICVPVLPVPETAIPAQWPAFGCQLHKTYCSFSSCCSQLYRMDVQCTMHHARRIHAMPCTVCCMLTTASKHYTLMQQKRRKHKVYAARHGRLGIHQRQLVCLGHQLYHAVSVHH